MLKRAGVFAAIVGAVAIGVLASRPTRREFDPPLRKAPAMNAREESDDPGLQPIAKDDVEWQKRLTPEQFRVARRKGTEQAFTGAYWDNHEQGVYRCVCCGQKLFDADTKFESGTGWPSFFQPFAPSSVNEHVDKTWWYATRTEIVCSRCDAHLGHVFDDGPKPTGLRYCMNSAALKFEKRDDAAK